MTRTITTRVLGALFAVFSLAACGSNLSEPGATATTTRPAATTAAPEATMPAPAAAATTTTTAIDDGGTLADQTTDPAATAPLDGTGATRTITVGGRGSAFGPPDRGVVDIGVSARRSTVAEATSAASAAGAALIDALIDSGVSPTDIQTSQFSINPTYDQYNYSLINGYETLIGYRVSMPDVTALGTMLARAVDAGGDTVRAWSVSFEGDPNAFMAPARETAWIDVRARAEATALEIGEPLGRLLDVHEKVLVSTPQGMMQGGEGDSASFEVPVAPGVVGVIVLLTATYQIGS